MRATCLINMYCNFFSLVVICIYKKNSYINDIPIFGLYENCYFYLFSQKCYNDYYPFPVLLDLRRIYNRINKNMICFIIRLFVLCYISLPSFLIYIHQSIVSLFIFCYISLCHFFIKCSLDKYKQKNNPFQVNYLVTLYLLML